MNQQLLGQIFHIKIKKIRNLFWIRSVRLVENASHAFVSLILSCPLAAKYDLSKWITVMGKQGLRQIRSHTFTKLKIYIFSLICWLLLELLTQNELQLSVNVKIWNKISRETFVFNIEISSPLILLSANIMSY
jgi:hypothetical protein